MGFVHCLAAVAIGVTGSAALLAEPATAAGPDSPSGPLGGSRLSGPGSDLSISIPTGWHQISDQANPELLQMVYPENCSEQVKCATAMARVLTIQATNAQGAAQAGEQAVAGLSGVQGATVTSEGPIQIAGRSGYHVRFSFLTPKAKFQADAAAVETGLPAAGMVPTSLIFVTVSDLAGAPPATVIDQIVGSAQLKAK